MIIPKTMGDLMLMTGVSAFRLTSAQMGQWVASCKQQGLEPSLAYSEGFEDSINKIKERAEKIKENLTLSRLVANVKEQETEDDVSELLAGLWMNGVIKDGDSFVEELCKQIPEEWKNELKVSADRVFAYCIDVYRDRENK